MKRMVAKWRKNRNESPSSAWLQINHLREKKKKVRQSLLYMKSGEANLEGTIQLFVMVCFLFIPILFPGVSRLGSEFEVGNDSTVRLILLIGSPILTLFSNIVATISSIDLSKGRQLSLKSKSVIALYLLFQLASNFFRMVPTVLVSLGDNPALTPRNAALLLSMPMLCHWILISMLMPNRIKGLPNQINHLINNMWSVVPIRLDDGRNEVHKAKEQARYLIIFGINLVSTLVATVLTMSGPKKLMRLMPSGPSNLLSFLQISPAAEEFLILGGAPSILCFLISCLLLTMYYRLTHTWREVGGERDLKCCCFCCCFSPIGRLCDKGTPVIGEVPVWEQVKVE